MDKLEIYLQVFQRNLFIKDKESIVNELRNTILEETGEDEEKINEVLNRMGNPAKLALTYSSSNQYLIGPEYYNSFIYSLFLTLKIVNLIYFIIVFVIIGLDVVNNILTTVSSQIGIANIFDGLIYINMFSIISVFVVFVILERTQTKDIGIEWSVKELPSKPTETISVMNSILLLTTYSLIVLGLYMLTAPIIINGNNIVIINENLIPLVIISMMLSFLEDIISKVKISSRLILLRLLLATVDFIISYNLFIRFQLIDTTYITNINIIIFLVLLAVYAWKLIKLGFTLFKLYVK